MNMFHLFPVGVGSRDLETPLTKQELAFLTGQTQRPNMGNTSSEDRYVLEKPEMKKFRAWIQTQVDSYFEEVYKPSSNVCLRITQSWTNHTEALRFHHKHAHPNSFVSGVFYIQTDASRDRIHFYRSGDWQQLKITPRDYHILNSESWWLEAVPGRLYLFPSSLTHMVETLPEGSETRISMSFNTFPVGVMGTEQELTALKLNR